MDLLTHTCENSSHLCTTHKCDGLGNVYIFSLGSVFISLRILSYATHVEYIIVCIMIIYIYIFEIVNAARFYGSHHGR